jgi:hypothetical protein
MEPLSDKELSAFLREWKAPSAPRSLEEKFFPSAPSVPSWRWLLNGTVRVPVPVAILLAAILLISALAVVWNRRPTGLPGREVTFADFQPVNQLQPRIIRSSHEGN